MLADDFLPLRSSQTLPITTFNMMLFNAEPITISLVVANTHLFPFFPASDTEQDAALKLEKERAEIVAKYDKVW